MNIARGLLGLALALSSFVVLAACGPERSFPPTDAGMDAGRVDAAEPPDLGPPPARCVGSPTPCVSFATAPECETAMGCAFSQCGGFAVACDTNPSESFCRMEPGCVWSGTACGGSPQPCGTFADSAACAMQAGCVWSARAQCRGTATPCESLTAATCTTQPGCGVEIPDAGPPDLGPPDAGCMGGAAGTTTLSLHTVTWAMAGGTMALGNVAVRADGPCAAAPIEMNTDAGGNLSLDLPNSGAPWSVTFARAGYSAISIMDVTNVGFDGDVQLDPVARPTYVEPGASGTVTGTVGIGNSVQVDTYDFDTTNTGPGGTWASTFSLAPAPNPAPPLVFVALELDATGRAVNFAVSGEQPRTASPVTGVAIALPAPAVGAIETRVTYHLPMTGIVDYTGSLVPFSVEHALLDVAQNPYVIVGSDTLSADVTPGDVTFTIRHFAGAFDANFTGFQIGSASGLGIMNVLLTDIRDHEVTIPPIVSLGIAGGSLVDLAATGVGDGFDVLIVHIGETDVEDPHWRVFADARSGSATIASVPQLPSSVSLADIGIVGGFTSVLPLYVKLQTGRGWSTQGMNQAIPRYAYAGGGSYVTLSTAGR